MKLKFKVASFGCEQYEDGEGQDAAIACSVTLVTAGTEDIDGSIELTFLSPEEAAKFPVGLELEVEFKDAQ
jgi:hypothetical protein